MNEGVPSEDVVTLQRLAKDNKLNFKLENLTLAAPAPLPQPTLIADLKRGKVLIGGVSSDFAEALEGDLQERNIGFSFSQGTRPSVTINLPDAVREDGLGAALQNARAATNGVALGG